MCFNSISLGFMYGLYFPVKKLGLRRGSTLQLSGSMGLLWIGGTKLSLDQDFKVPSWPGLNSKIR